jgi:hypothetical protein
MNTYQDYSQQETIPVPRSRVFVLDDGTFVVQWEENRVQGLLNGRYFIYEPEQFGTAISDYELTQLRNSGIVDDFDDELVYLSSGSSLMTQSPTRTYYLNTTLPKSKRDYVENALRAAALLDRYSVRVQQTFVIIRGPAGIPFQSFDDAERARENLSSLLPELLQHLVVAFVEVNTTF